MAKVGKYNPYNPDFHPKEIIRLMKDKGFAAVQVVRDWNIHIDTLHEWCKVHPEMSEAYTRAKHYRTAWWLDRAQEGILTEAGKSFDSRLFGLMMKYTGVNLDERIVKLPELVSCKTFSEQSTCIISALAVGRLTINEANKIVDIISKAARIEEVTELRKMLEEIELARKQGR